MAGITPDIANAVLVLIGAGFISFNCRCVLVDGAVAGVRWFTAAFFATWSAWNLYYYAALTQPFSWWAGVVMLIADICWVALLVRHQEKP